MLADLLAPLPQDEFLADYWTKRFVHVPGPPEKYAHLFSWEVLNRALEQHRFPPPRLALVKGGATIGSEHYLNADRVIAAGLTQELAAGATLVFNACEEVHPPLRTLCVELERLFHVYVHVNLYAGWRKDNGFGIHWDEQDTLILQVAGRKHWKVWAPTRTHPFKRDIVETSPQTQPEGPPLWDDVLDQGGLLSMPRGWWHVAYPMDEPCLHLTVTIKNLNGIDLLRWFADRMKASDAARMELPIVAGEEEKQAWFAAVRRDIAAAWTSDLLERFVSEVDGRAEPRPTVHLPTVDAASFVIDRDAVLELAVPRALHFEAANGVVTFSAAGTNWKTTGELAPALARFNDGLPHAVAEFDSAQSRSAIAFLTALVMKGVLRHASTPDSASRQQRR